MTGHLRLGSTKAGLPEFGEVVIRIYRPHALGNPYRVGKTWSRAEAIAAFRSRLEREMAARSGRMYQAIREIGGLIASSQDVLLLCKCPLKCACHGTVVIENVNKLLKEEYGIGT